MYERNKYSNTTELVRNLLAVWRQSTDREIRTGLVWYPSVHDWCQALSRRYRTDVVRIAAALAVLSPKIEWRLACKDLVSLLDALDSGQNGDEVTTSAMGQNRTKAIQILTGASGLVSGPKVECFFDNLCGNSQNVTVDVWAMRAAIGQYAATARWLTYRQNERIQLAYQRAADIAGLAPRDFQAIIWLTVQRLNQTQSVQLELDLGDPNDY